MSDDRELIEVFGKHLPAIQQQLQRQTESTEDTPMESAPAAPTPADTQAHKKQKAHGPQQGEPSGTRGPQPGEPGEPSKGHGRSGQNRRQGYGKGWRRNDREGREASSSTSRDDRRLLTQLALLSLRQEDELQLLRTEKQLFLNADTKPHGLTKTMYQVAVQWKKTREGDPGKLTQSLRVTLMQCLMLEWHKRLEEMMKTAETREAMKKWGYILEEEGETLWLYQKWNQDHKKMESDPTKTPIKHNELLLMVTEMKQAIHDHREAIIHKFASTRPMTENMQPGVLPFILSIGMRLPEAAMVCNHLARLEGSTALMIVGMQLRKERLKRQPLAQEISKALGNR
jgi:hypothetical protein